jgi:uncharacterized protein
VSARRVLIAGVSTRAAAESAARAGFDVTAIDRFADADQHPDVTALLVPGTFTAHAAARAVRRVECDAVVYLSNFENHPTEVRSLAANRTLWGNRPEVVTRVRDPIAVAQAFRDRGFATPASYVAQGGSPALAALQGCATSECNWLLKPLASGGGHGIRRWSPGDSVSRGCYLQELIDGTPASVVFVAADGRAVPLGVFRQLIGDTAFGAAGFQYCGNILATGTDRQFGHGEAIVDAACALARSAADAFGLVGVNGIDFVARDGIPYPVEINPRWCASMELVERAYGISVFGIHAAACDRGTLPDFDLLQARRSAQRAHGKAVVFARKDLTVGDIKSWLPPAQVDTPAVIRDIPHAGTNILAGRPICTVFADGVDEAACYTALVARAERIYADLAAWQDERGTGF